MNKNFASLSRYLLPYDQEYLEYISIVNSYYFPALLKIAQQIPLFENSDNTPGIESQYPDDFSFKSLVGNFGLDEESAEVLDIFLDKLKEHNPSTNTDDLIGQIKSDFINNGNRYNSRYYNVQNFFDVRQESLNKYLKLFPELKWSPQYQQLMLPFDNQVLQTKPLGISRVESEEDLSMLDEKYRLLLKDDIAADILKKPVSNLSSINWSDKGTLSSRLNILCYQNNLKYNGSDLEKILNIHFKNTHDVAPEAYLKSDIEKIQDEIENKWNELSLLYSEVQKLKADLDPGSFSPKSDSEINNFSDLVYAAAEYSKWILKKISSENIEFTPFKQLAKSNSIRTISYGIDSFKNVFEKITLDNNPKIDGDRKIGMLSEEILNCKSSIENYKKYKSLSKRMDKDLFKECEKYLNARDSKSINSINWIEKYRPDLIKKSYNDAIKIFASSIPSEFSKYGFNDISSSVYSKKIYEILYSAKTNQAEVMGKVVGHLAGQEYLLGKYIGTYIINKIKESLVNKGKTLFEQEYFTCPINASIESNGELSLSGIEVSVDIDNLRRFIDSWSGKPNIKSYINTLYNSTKNNDFVNNYLKSLVLKDSDKFNGVVTTSLFDDISEELFNSISKTNANTEEELILEVTNSLMPKFYESIKNMIAKEIFDRLSNTNLFSRVSTNNQIRLDESNKNSLGAIAPNVVSSIFSSWLNTSDPKNKYTGSTTPVVLYRLVSGLLTEYSNAKVNNPSIFRDLNISTFNSDDENIDKIYLIMKDMQDVNNVKKLNYDGVIKALEIVSPILSIIPTTSYSGNIMPLLEGGTILIKNNCFPELLVGNSYKIIKKKSHTTLTLEVDGKMKDFDFSRSNEGSSYGTNIDFFIKTLSPTKEDLFKALDSLGLKVDVKNMEIKYVNIENSKKNIQLILNELGLPWSEAYRDGYEMQKFESLVREYNSLDYKPNRISNTVLKIINEIKTINTVSTFNEETKLIAEAFNGVGFRDISSGIEDLFSRNNLKNSSKKEFITKISGFVNSTLSGDNYREPEDILLMKEFLKCISNKEFYENKFDNIITPILKALNIDRYDDILKTCYQVNTSSGNYKKDDLLAALEIVELGDSSIPNNIRKIISSAKFVHNNSSLPKDFAASIVNSPNFYSDTKISKEYTEGCLMLYKFGGIDSIMDTTSHVGGIIDKMVVSELISDPTEFRNQIKVFSELCANKNGIRPNLGNGTAEIKLDYMLNSIASRYGQDATIRMETFIPTWLDSSFEDRVSNLIDFFSSRPPSAFYGNPVLSNISDAFTSGKLSSEIKKVRETSSSEEQYYKDLKVKQDIKKSISYLKILSDSTNLIKYAKDAKKKDTRLFNFEYTDPNDQFRFRVLRDLDPYHFSVGADTDCCQRVGGDGHYAAIDSFINPLAGVLLLEVKMNREWTICSQSYFHYIPQNNGLILDNVEWNKPNCMEFYRNKKYNIDITYAAFAEYIKNKYNLSYVRCGAGWNKLSNDNFKSTKLPYDPRNFATKTKYTDFKTSSHIDLLSPKFPLTINFVDE